MVAPPRFPRNAKAPMCEAGGPVQAKRKAHSVCTPDPPGTFMFAPFATFRNAPVQMPQMCPIAHNPPKCIIDGEPDGSARHSPISMGPGQSEGPEPGR